MSRERVTQAQWDADRAKVKKDAAKTVAADAKKAKAAKDKFLNRNANGVLDEKNLKAAAAEAEDTTSEATGSSTE